MKIPQAAKELNRHPRTIKRWIQSGLIKAVKSAEIGKCLNQRYQAERGQIMPCEYCGWSNGKHHPRCPEAVFEMYCDICGAG